MNLKEFSALLKLSPTTVSRALNGYPEVSEATRQKVLAAAEKYHYRPSHHAKTLAGGATKSIGHIVARNSYQLIDPHFADFIAGASEVYSKHCYDLNLSLVSKEKERETYLNFIRTRKVDGIMVQSPVINDWRITLLRDSGMPFVVHGRSDEQNEDYGLIDVQNRRAFRRATQFLIELGHQRIALINGVESLNFAKRRKEGYIQSITSNNLPIIPALNYSSTMTEPHGYEATQNALNLPYNERPTALLIASMLPALGARRAIIERGLKIPDDISLLVYDDCLSFLQDDNSKIPAFTCLRSSIFKHGKQAAKQIINQIKHPNQPTVQTIWDAELVIGCSTCAAPTSCSN